MKENIVIHDNEVDRLMINEIYQNFSQRALAISPDIIECYNILTPNQAFYADAGAKCQNHSCQKRIRGSLGTLTPLGPSPLASQYDVFVFGPIPLW